MHPRAQNIHKQRSCSCGCIEYHGWHMDGETKVPKKIRFNGVTYQLSGSYYVAPPSVREEHSNLHRAIWAHHHGPIPEGHHIHHRNGDTKDNRIENLECLSVFEHLSMHAK